MNKPTIPTVMDSHDMKPKQHLTHRPLFWLAVPLLTSLAFPAFGQTWKINLLNADINAFVSEVADITGKNFAVDPRVKGNVTVISNKELNKQQVYELFEGVLNVNGVVAIPSGNTIKLVPDVNAKQSGVPFDFRNRARGDGVVTRVIWLDNTNPNDLVPALRPLLSQFAHLAAVPGTNALIVSDRAQSIDQLAELVRSLDGGADDQMDIIQLKETSVDDIVGQIEALTSTSPSKDPRGSRLRLIADSKNNRLLVKGNEKARNRIKNMVAQLDVASDRLGGLRVFRLKNASAKSMADILQGIVTGSSNGSRSSSGSSGSNYSGSSTSSLGSGTSASGSTTGSTGTSSSGSNSTAQSSVFSANGISIIANEELNSIVVKADPSMMREIASTIEQLDVRRAQVLIQAAIVEVSGTNAQQLGVQWALGNASTGVGLVNFGTAGTGTSLANIATAIASKTYTGINPAGALIGLGTSKTNSKGETSFYGAVLNALNSTTSNNLISVPSVMALDNVKAEMVVGQNVPFITGTQASTTAGVAPFNSIERKDVGTTLKVTPHIGEGGTIRLDVEQEVSSIAAASSIGATTSDLVTNKRSVKTTVLADDGQTIVLGGMMQDDNTQQMDMVPGLGRLPLIGGLFRSKANSTTKNNLLIFLQPTILRDGSNVEAISQDRYERTRILQLQLDPKGQFTRLPANVNDIYASAVTNITPSFRAALNNNLGRDKPAAVVPNESQNTKPSSTVPVTPAALPEKTPPTQTQP
ncbi:type II secretion system secretin GspD [Aquirhabdus parva]|uniref:Type II secretion system protein GspD n=1 Tax=Aquirhabdus parva TaxID=2283318 RepID=A0A345P7W7_9GAMM|nr:type II secretion system secretin GspD [Aquirhabdus parva]AXI03376.1 type II secretion system protein GspD [Aquirhabdus parva]